MAKGQFEIKILTISIFVQIFAMNDWQDDELDRPTVEIENVTIKLSWQSMSIYRELFGHIKRRM